MECLGIDIGGSGIKGAVVDTRRGVLISERLRLKTPAPATPNRVAESVSELVKQFSWRRSVGCGFPGVVRSGEILTAANVSKKWLNLQADELMRRVTGRRFVFANDADLAGLAEAHFGAGRKDKGFQILLTLGTGVGSALLDGKTLVPNTELGHLRVDGHEIDNWASVRAKNKEGLSWKKWSRRLDRCLHAVHDILWPERFIIGGGISKKHDRFLHLLSPPCPVIPAELRNEAGIVGAALAVRLKLKV